MRSMTVTAFMAAALILSACATTIPWDGGYAPVQPGMTKGQVEMAFGSPTRSFLDADGNTVWVYEKAGAPSDAVVSSTELIVRFAGDRVMNSSHSTSTTITTTTFNP